MFQIIQRRKGSIVWSAQCEDLAEVFDELEGAGCDAYSTGVAVFFVEDPEDPNGVGVRLAPDSLESARMRMREVSR